MACGCEPMPARRLWNRSSPNTKIQKPSHFNIKYLILYTSRHGQHLLRTGRMIFASERDGNRGRYILVRGIREECIL